MASCARRRSWVLAAAVLGSTLAFVDESVVNVALPGIESALRTSLVAMQWVVNAYTLCMSALLLLGGAAADQFGRRLMFMIGVSVFAAASLGCGFAPDVQVLIATRSVQGIGAALLVPCSLALIGAAFAEEDRGGALRPEFDAQRILALAALGRRTEACAGAARFLAENSSSPLAPQVRASCDTSPSGH